MTGTILMNIPFLDDAIEETARQHYNKPDWDYFDLPKISPELFEEFLEVVGEDNLEFLTFARYPNNTVRGQMLISPVGTARLDSWVKENSQR